MIKHIVCFSLAAKETDQRDADLAVMRSTLEGLVGEVPQLRHLEVGFDLGLVGSHWDALLLTEFETRADLEAYQSHPRHVAGLATINPLVAARAVVDYEI